MRKRGEQWKWAGPCMPDRGVPVWHVWANKPKAQWANVSSGRLWRGSRPWPHHCSSGFLNLVVSIIFFNVQLQIFSTWATRRPQRYPSDVTPVERDNFIQAPLDYEKNGRVDCLVCHESWRLKRLENLKGSCEACQAISAGVEKNARQKCMRKK